MKNRRFGKRVNWQSHSSGSAPVAIHRRLEIDESPVFINASEYPFTLDLKTKVKHLGANPEINIIRIREISESSLSTVWTSENNFLTIDEKGVLSYTPKGTYLNNRLVVEFEAADEHHPPTAQARQIGDRYEASTPSPSEPTSRNNLSPVQGKVAIQVKNDILGDPEKAKEFWMHQVDDPTCAVAAIASILASLGRTVNGEPIDYLDVLNEVAVRVDADEDIIGPLPLYLASNGEPQYTVYEDGEGNRIVKMRDTGDKWEIVSRLLKHYNVTSHTGQADHFSTIIRELGAGNKILAYVDGREMRSTDYITKAWEHLENQTFNGPNGTKFTKADHAVWITGLDYTDRQNPVVILNDPGTSRGAGLRIPLEQFLAGWEDGGFMYTSTGNSAPDILTQHKRHDIEWTLYQHFLENPDDGDLHRLTSDFFYNYINNSELAQKIEAKNPGFKWDIRGYLYDLNQQEKRIFEKYGLDAETINSFYSNVDVSEWLIENNPIITLPPITVTPDPDEEEE